ncbi:MULTISPECIES: ornithine cyclodeaminase [Xanthobacteraceae]|uniref:Ornithine cyclodeaminase n=1 Tax=Labrys monachus TaxID=217067 RepID=A0ABU0FFY5_9HYPH|nr:MULTISPECIES: ornithine cyclodeaminase [Xanthobacteraceae]MBS7538219.1 ornithine cyclodeaminase [Ancylobacter lacus]MDQ0393521.1 ornithine cyclodeaminase [Labrys monachus]
MTHRALNIVPFVSVHNMMRLVNAVGVERFLTELATFVEDDFRRWPVFDKTPRLASHSVDGVIELMPTSDGITYGFKYVNGHPKNMRVGRQTVTAFGLLADVATGYPVLLSEMTILTALRTAATSAVAALHLARPGSRTMAIIGNGAQSEFQAVAFKALLGIDRLRLYDIERWASEKCARNLARYGFDVTICDGVASAVEGADIVTTVTADKQNATILTDNLVGAGQHINAVGGDCPGKTELHRDILLRADIFVEYPPQTRIEGEIQQLAADHPVTEFWRVIAGEVAGRRSAEQITLFDSVGFATEDFSALRYVRSKLALGGFHEDLDLLADPDEPRDLLGMVHRAAVSEISRP